MRSRTEAHLPGRCKRCYLKERWCLCPLLPRVRSRAEVLIVRHGREAEKSTNSGRIAALALESCTLIDYTPYAADGPDGDACLQRLEESIARMPAPALLFPGEGPPLPPAPSHLIVLDGTWRQARKMLKAIPALAGLPRLALPPPAVTPRRLRRSPYAENQSTLEAIAAALALLEGAHLADPLHALHAELVERVLLGRGLLSPEEATLSARTPPEGPAHPSAEGPPRPALPDA
jgi:DTW domain-containing protein